MTKNLPAWLATEITLRSDKGIVVRSETVEELHARTEREQGIKWDAITQKWIKA